MMIRAFQYSIAIATAATLGIVCAYTASAVTAANDVITDEQISTIRSRCGEIQATLNRVHESDKVLRVNKGYLYKAIVLDKLMTPLNQRIAANQVDGGKLGKMTADFNQTFREFDGAYSKYERDLSAALETDCTKQPTAFYDKTLVAYASRQNLYKIDAELIALSKEFKAEATDVLKAVDKKEGTSR